MHLALGNGSKKDDRQEVHRHVLKRRVRVPYRVRPGLGAESNEERSEIVRVSGHGRYEARAYAVSMYSRTARSMEPSSSMIHAYRL